MTVQLLDDAHAARLRSVQYTYAAVGQTASDPPAGFNSLVRSVTLARRDFDDAAHDLLTWRLHERSGLQVWASDTAADGQRGIDGARCRADIVAHTVPRGLRRG